MANNNIDGSAKAILERETPSLNKFICFHAHFHQPPRENPWLGEAEREESARPYYDWNERIFHECYAPNMASPIMDADGSGTLRLVNNFEKLSFDFDPALLSWLERHHPPAYRQILESDRKSASMRSGHGNAIAQAYGHAILPLCSLRDKRTHVRWAAADFSHRFGRHPEGMWLAETAVDCETLEVLAEEGISFTILSPSQAARTDLDTTRAYRWFSRKNKGRFVDIFFYDAAVSAAVVFEKLLRDGKELALRLLSAGSQPEADRSPAGLPAGRRAGAGADSPHLPLTHMATDGECYGYHYKSANMALAFALEYIEKGGEARLTNYGEYLEMFPPEMEVEIKEATSWSCIHGIERWRDNCGCGRKTPGWHQKWRKPLREALDWLACELDSLYERESRDLFKDPWHARDAYIRRILERTAGGIAFLKSETKKHLSLKEIRRAFALLEMQRCRLMMFSSCGWFFEEISGMESKQILKFAAKALQIAKSLGRNLESEFRGKLSLAMSNLPQIINGDTIYLKHVLPDMTDLRRAAAACSIGELLGVPPSPLLSKSFRIGLTDIRRSSRGARKGLTCRATVRNLDTLEDSVFTAAAVHRGRLDLECFLKEGTDYRTHLAIEGELADEFRDEDDMALCATCQRIFGKKHYDIDALFKEERSLIQRQLLRSETSHLRLSS